MLIKAVLAVESLKQNKQLIKAIEDTALYLVSIVEKSNGCVPYNDDGSTDYAVHFCHGPPGAIYTLTAALELFHQSEHFERYLNAA
jgi:hypothetical protein